eukprot:7990953-Alexandrium_andersonii.AAC.1
MFSLRACWGLQPLRLGLVGSAAPPARSAETGGPQTSAYSERGTRTLRPGGPTGGCSLFRVGWWPLLNFQRCR